jgi:hypothetical protein
MIARGRPIAAELRRAIADLDGGPSAVDRPSGGQVQTLRSREADR